MIYYKVIHRYNLSKKSPTDLKKSAGVHYLFPAEQIFPIHRDVL